MPSQSPQKISPPKHPNKLPLTAHVQGYEPALVSKYSIPNHYLPGFMPTAASKPPSPFGTSDLDNTRKYLLYALWLSPNARINNHVIDVVDGDPNGFPVWHPDSVAKAIVP